MLARVGGAGARLEGCLADVLRGLGVLGGGGELRSDVRHRLRPRRVLRLGRLVDR